MARRRTRITSGDGRRVTAEAGREDSGDEPDEPEGEPEDSGTSLDDLTSEADPATFDRTFLSTDADLQIQGRYDPVAGPKQVLPRVAYVINYNMVYNEDRGRWEPKKNVRLIDGFEDGDISEYAGDTGSFTVDQADPVFAGDFSLKCTSNNSHISFTDPDGLPITPRRGDTFGWRIQLRNGVSGGEMAWGVNQVGVTGQYYSLSVDATGDLRLQINGGGPGNFLDTASITAPQNEWIRCEVVWGDPTITGRAFDDDGNELGEVQADDQTYDKGGIGWDSSQSTGTPDLVFDQAVLIDD